MLELKATSYAGKDNKSIYVYDYTKLYNSINNLTGYGGINPDTTDILTATLTITKPLETTSTIIDVFGTFPSIDPGAYFKIVNTDIGFDADTKLTLGVYKITYTVTGVFNSLPFTFSVDADLLGTNQVECCIDTKISKMCIDVTKCGCVLSKDQKEDLMTISVLRTLVNSAKDSLRCGNKNNAQKIIECADKLCKSGCSCGCSKK